MKKLILIALLGVSTLNADIFISNDIKTEWKDCRKNHPYIRELSNNLVGISLALQTGQDKSWDFMIMALNRMNELKREMFARCGNKT